MNGFVYILSNKSRTTFYIGATNDLHRRLSEHRRGKSWFSARYNLRDLIYYEALPSIHEAKARENQLKNWHRKWKLNLIKEKNPQLKDLSAEIIRKSDAETSSASSSRKQDHSPLIPAAHFSRLWQRPGSHPHSSGALVQAVRCGFGLASI